MQNVKVRVGIGLLLCLVTGAAVFWLPFLLPPPVLQGQSAANAAGFNNKVASVAAALISIAVLFLRTRSRQELQFKGDDGRLKPLTILGGVAATLAGLGCLCYLLIASNTRYSADAGYFIAQMSDYQVYKRTLYTQIEFPYGPLLFYGPIWMYSALRPAHVSLTVAYCLTMLLEQIIGLVLLAYVINSLGIRKTWRTLFFLLCVVLSVPVNAGVNYTYFRFIIPAASLVFLSRLDSPLFSIIWVACAQLLALYISPEMGLSFLAGSAAVGLYRAMRQNKVWLASALVPLLATAGFLFANRTGYLRMLALFAGGINNLIVEPVPFVLLFLFAFVWLVPCYVAHLIRDRHPQAPRALALYFSGIALLPVGFGRTDPQHLFFNEISIYALSLAAIAGWRMTYQKVWAVCLSLVLLWTACITALYPQCRSEYDEAFKVLYPLGSRPRRAAIYVARVLHLHGTLATFAGPAYSWERFDSTTMEHLTGGSPVNTPIAFGYNIELYLRSKGEFIPTFYNFQTAVLDRAAERRQIDALKASSWMLLPKYFGPVRSEAPEDTQWMMGISLPYRARRQPYVLGQMLADETKRSWQPVADLGSCILWHHR